MRIGVIFFIVVCWFGVAEAQDRTITVASTTSTEQSGLFGYLLPRFTEATEIGVKVVAVGTGQALDIGRRGDAEVVFVHDRPAEEGSVGIFGPSVIQSRQRGLKPCSSGLLLRATRPE
jgi:tungstate transport system substrate-binding protein